MCYFGEVLEQAFDHFLHIGRAHLDAPALRFVPAQVAVPPPIHERGNGKHRGLPGSWRRVRHVDAEDHRLDFPREDDPPVHRVPHLAVSHRVTTQLGIDLEHDALDSCQLEIAPQLLRVATGRRDAELAVAHPLDLAVCHLCVVGALEHDDDLRWEVAILKYHPPETREILLQAVARVGDVCHTRRSQINAFLLAHLAHQGLELRNHAFGEAPVSDQNPPRL
mmetsp:Transcript_18006/g.36318  ORF Transcript_18006/g.36318 Transcript_18006/m.36318 type:complete len:222 (-) Transcript_18006:1720-2385(-)